MLNLFLFFKGQLKSLILHTTRDGSVRVLCFLPFALCIINKFSRVNLGFREEGEGRGRNPCQA